MNWKNILKMPYREQASDSWGATVPLSRLPETIQLMLNQVWHKQFRFKEEKVNLTGVDNISDTAYSLVSAIHGTEHLFNVMNWKTGKVGLKWYYYRTGYDDDQWMMGSSEQDKHNRRVARLEPPKIPSNLTDDDIMIVLRKGGWSSHAGSYRRPARIDIYVNKDSDFFDNLEGKPETDSVDLTNGEMMALLAVQGYYGKPKYKAFNNLNIGEGEFGAENTIYQSLVEKGYVTFKPNHRRANLRNFPLITQKTRTMFDDFFSFEETYENRDKLRKWVEDLKSRPVGEKVKIDYNTGDEE